MKLKALLQSLVSQIRSVTRSLSKMKLIIIDVKELFVHGHLTHHLHVRKIKRTRKVNLHGSFRLHYNWCSSSSHVAPEPPPLNKCYRSSSRSNWTISVANYEGSVTARDPSELSGYLNWLEENGEVDETNEIDKLADLFIANCHEKFMLEKQESYRMFQEMMARSI